MHRRLTFHAGQQVSWFTAQWEGGGLAGVGLVATSLTLAGVHALIGPVGAGVQLLPDRRRHRRHRAGPVRRPAQLGLHPRPARD